MTTDIRSSRRSKSGYWLLQFASGESVDYIYRGFLQRWQARKEMQAGDGVVLWKPGKEAGVFGLGRIIPDPNKRFLKFEKSVEWKCTYKSKDVLLRDDLRNLNDTDLNRLLAVRGFLKAGVERISESQWRRINQHLRKKSEVPNSRSEDHICEKISVEQMLVERTTADQKHATRPVLRRESKLLKSYNAYMKVRGFQFESRKMRAAGEDNFIRCDLFESKLGVLFEAKGLSSREAIRMAIGELHDYSRFIKPIRSLAVLLPERPSDDLEKLLTGQKIKVVWQTKNGFADNSNGQLS